MGSQHGPANGLPRLLERMVGGLELGDDVDRFGVGRRAGDHRLERGGRELRRLMRRRSHGAAGDHALATVAAAMTVDVSGEVDHGLRGSESGGPPASVIGCHMREPAQVGVRSVEDFTTQRDVVPARAFVTVASSYPKRER